jgi:SsrA-binding protein
MGKKDEQGETVCRNKKAFHLYAIEERIEAGLELAGSEVKSLRLRNADLSDAYAAIRDGEVFLFQAHIAEYKNAGYGGHEPKRARRLLLHRPEIRRLRGKLVERGFTLVPLAIYFKGGWAKVLLGLAKGKRKFDRRKAIQEKDMRRALRKEHD